MHGGSDIFNLPPVAGLVEERTRTAGLASRLGFVGGDFLNGPLPGGYDVLSFVRVLHDWPADIARMLLEKARQALSPSGRLVICEEFRTRERLAVQFFWTYFLVGADACTSRLREVTWYTEALAAVGFADVRVIPGPFDVIVATRGEPGDVKGTACNTPCPLGPPSLGENDQMERAVGRPAV